MAKCFDPVWNTVTFLPQTFLYQLLYSKSSFQFLWVNIFLLIDRYSDPQNIGLPYLFTCFICPAAVGQVRNNWNYLWKHCACVSLWVSPKHNLVSVELNLGFFTLKAKLFMTKFKRSWWLRSNIFLCTIQIQWLHSCSSTLHNSFDYSYLSVHLCLMNNVRFHSVVIMKWSIDRNIAE